MKENETYPLLAKTFEGLEDLLVEELAELGATEIVKQNRAANFKGNDEVLYRVNYASRFALRILKPLFHFNAEDPRELYLKARELDWGKVFNLHHTFSIDTLAFNSEPFQNTMYASLKLKDAIADHFRDKYGARPYIEKDNADIRINLHISGEKCVISLDSSGESLSLRGYRRQEHVAPVNEVLAAALVKISGWDGNTNFIDPMCGSGTILIEAAMKMLGIPAGYFRKSYSFHNWTDFNAKLWAEIRDEYAFQQIRPKVKIKGGDLSDAAVLKAGDNIREAGLQRYISVEKSDIKEFKPPRGGGVLLTNPPYGDRFKVEDLRELYTEMGNQFKNRFTDYTAWVLSADLEALKSIGLRSSEKFKLFNGALESRFVRYDLFEGSQRDFILQESVSE